MNSNEKLEKAHAAREAIVAVSGRGKSGHGDLVTASLNRYLWRPRPYTSAVDEQPCQDEGTAGKPR
jgi:hypothetical protein